jgi:hypothetical protein
MRSLFAFILGIAFTVGVAYVRDTQVAGPSAKPLVNWTEVADTTRSAMDFTRAQWDRLTGNRS